MFGAYAMPEPAYQKGDPPMTKEYIYKGEKFSVSKPDDCEMKVTKNGCTATISIAEQSGKFRVSAHDGIIAETAPTENAALDAACRRITSKLAASSKEELCSRLDSLYEGLDK